MGTSSCFNNNIMKKKKKNNSGRNVFFVPSILGNGNGDGWI